MPNPEQDIFIIPPFNPFGGISEEGILQNLNNPEDTAGNAHYFTIPNTIPRIFWNR
jgi:hypothetical protein